jgi:glycosyltransferase involved in cell wall biosynthesis
MVSPYPAPDSKRSGMAWYTKNLLDNMPSDTEVLVIADRSNAVPSDYIDGRSKVYRSWSYGLRFYWDILKQIRGLRPDLVHFQHEIFLYGSVVPAVLFPLLVLMVRMMGIPVVVTLHNGILPLSEINGPFLKENGIQGPPRAMKYGLRGLLGAITLFSSAVLVHEDKLRSILIDEYGCPPGKVAVVHHGIEPPHAPLPMDRARSELGMADGKVVLFLGYIAGYKNLELLIDAAKLSRTDGWTLVVGGGDHPRLANDPSYTAYVRSIKDRALGAPPGRIRFVGFIPEDRLGLYVSASDLIVFPYKTCMSASGPLTIAMSYGRPILLSTAFRGIVDLEDMMFGSTAAELAYQIDIRLTEKGRNGQKIAELVDSRQWKIVSQQTDAIYRRIVEGLAAFSGPSDLE